MPGLSSADASTHVAIDFTSALKNPAPASLFAHLRTENLGVLRNLSEIFKGKITGKQTSGTER